MTPQSAILNDPLFTAVHDHGFIGITSEEMTLADGSTMLVPAVLGNDKSIVRAARVSYGDGTKHAMDDRNLIRYLVRHHHWTPVEMVTFKFHLKLPIFVMRQLVRTRTAKINEMSARYSILSDEFYIPALEDINRQSEVNNQGRGEVWDEKNAEGTQWVMQAASDHSLSAYRTLLGEEIEDFYDLYGSDPMLGEDFKGVGVARELARAVMPVNGYTELYWKIDLRNLLNFLRLRLDSHAQKEIRDYAEAMYRQVQKFVPLACEAFEDYMVQSASVSRMGVDLIRALLAGEANRLELEVANEVAMAERHGMSLRELREFKKQWL